MSKPVSQPRIIRFDKYEADLHTGKLTKRGMRVMLREQSFAVLAALLERPGELVTREELRKRLWPEDIFVDFDNLLNTAVARLRAALGDSTESPRFIETLPKRGYRFIGSISGFDQTINPSPASRVKMAVLPFANLSGDSGQDYFSDAITDEMITALAALAPGHLAVIARTTAMHYKGSGKDVLRIGRELDVDYVVEGGVHQAQDRLTVNVQLIQVKDQMHLFARKYDVELRDIFKLMNRAAWDIAESVGITPVTGDNEGSGVGGHERKEPTGDMAAYNEYILGRHFLYEAMAEGFAKAKQHLESAISRDPEFAPAYDALAELNWYLGYLGYMPPRKAFSAGIMLALRAIEIDNTRAETHALLGQFHKICEYNWAEVRREMTLARQLDPESPLVRLRYAASWLMPQGHLEEAVAEVECALQLDPLSVMAWVWLGILRALTHHQHEEALAAGRRALELNPKSWGPYISIGTTYRDQGDFEQAIEAYRKGVEVSGNLPYMIGCLGLTLGLSGNAAEARSALKRLEAYAAQGFVPPSSFAWVYLGLGEIDVAFEWLDRAVDECDQYMMPIKSYRFFDPIRKDPRFQTLLRKMNLEA